MTTPVRADIDRARAADEPARAADEPWRLVLRIAGGTPLSERAIAHARRIGEDHLGAGWSLEIVDLLERPPGEAAVIGALVPALVREHPLPRRLVFGDLSETAQVLAGLGIGRLGGAG